MTKTALIYWTSANDFAQFLWPDTEFDQIYMTVDEGDLHIRPTAQSRLSISQQAA